MSGKNDKDKDKGKSAPGNTSTTRGRMAKFPPVSVSLPTKPPDGEIDTTQLAKNIVGSVYFDVFVGFIIVLSALSIGAELSFELEGMDTLAFTVLEHMFLICYIGEFALRWKAWGRDCLKSTWIRFDVFLILIGVLTFWILEPALSKETMRGFGPLMMIRTLRLLRLFRAIRFFAHVKEFWVLVRGFLSCLPMVLYTMTIIVCCLYVFACLGVELITKNSRRDSDAGFDEVVERYFNTLPHTMLTLVRFVCLDNTAEVYLPLATRDPVLAVYFMVLTLIVSIITFHLLGAVVFSSTLDQTQEEADCAKREQSDTWTHLISGLRELFFRLDQDMSGQLSKQELNSIDPSDWNLLSEALNLKSTTVSSPAQVFAALDVDGSGEISIDEFFDGVRDILLDDAAMNQKRMEKQVETMHWRMKEMFSAQYEMKLQIARLSKDLGISGTSPRDSPRNPSMNSSSLRQATEMMRQKSPPSRSDRAMMDELPVWAQELTDSLRKSYLEGLRISLESVQTAAIEAMASRSQRPAGSKGIGKNKLPAASPEGQKTNSSESGSTSTSSHGAARRSVVISQPSDTNGVTPMEKQTKRKSVRNSSRSPSPKPKDIEAEAEASQKAVSWEVASEHEMPILMELGAQQKVPKLSLESVQACNM